MFIIYRTQYVSTVSTQEGINKMNVSKSITEHKIHFLLFEIMYSSREEKTNMHDPRFDPDWAISQDRDNANSFSAPFKSFHIILIFWRPSKMVSYNAFLEYPQIHTNFYVFPIDSHVHQGWHLVSLMLAHLVLYWNCLSTLYKEAQMSSRVESRACFPLYCCPA